MTKDELEQRVFDLTVEREALRKRVKNQRTELRRLNKYLGPYWAGFKRGPDFELAKTIRIHMFEEFGQPAVFIAEQKTYAPKESK